MKVFNIILGIFSIIGASYCMFFPGMTFLNCGWIVAALLGVYGVCSIFEFFSAKKNKVKKSNKLLIGGVFGLIFGIAAVVISILALVDVRTRLWMDLFILIDFSCWLVFSGVASIAEAFTAKKANGGKMWILTLVMGILVILAGIFGLCHPILNAMSLGLIIGANLMIYGIRLLATPFEPGTEQ